jgi:hypothetical protein
VDDGTPVTITAPPGDYIQIDHHTGHRYRLRLPTPSEIDLACEGYDNCQFDITAYHRH